MLIVSFSSVGLRDRVHANAATVRDIVQQHGGSSHRIMGSVACREHTTESDLDIPVRPYPQAFAARHCRDQTGPRDVFGVEVDVVVSIEISDCIRDLKAASPLRSLAVN